MHQMWCQSFEPFDRFPWLFNVWPPKTPPNAPLCLLGQFVWRISIPRWICTCVPKLVPIGPAVSHLPLTFEFVTPTPPPPQMLRGKLYLAYVHSQTNPQTCTKFGANRSSRLTASPDFLICDPLKPPKCPSVSWGSICLAYIHSQINLHMCAKFGVNRSNRLVAFPEFMLS